MPSIQRQNALAFLANADAHDYPALENLLSDDFTHCILPASLGGFGLPVRTKNQYIENLQRLESIIERFNFQPAKEIIEAEGVVILHTTSDGKTSTGEPYRNEYIYMFRFEGEKIINIKEFMDSKYVSHIVGNGY